VQKANNDTASGSDAKLAFAKSLFQREYADLSKTPTTIAGIVVIFDSEDGGRLAATVPVIRQWKAGTLSDAAFWRRCFADPPEALSPVNAPVPSHGKKQTCSPRARVRIPPL
jgi:hypothetical protein